MLKDRTSWSFTAFLVFSAACWGFGTVMTKRALEFLPPFTLSVVQLAASSAFLWTMAAVRRLRLPPRRETLRLGLTGLLEPGFTITFAVLGLRLTTASMATLIYAAQPVLIMSLAWLLLREQLSPLLIGFAALAVFGVILVAGIDGGTGSSGSPPGNLLILASLFCCSIYLVLSRRWVTSGLDPILLVALQQTVGLAWALVVWPIDLRGIQVGSLATIDPSVWVWAAASGVVYYALGFWFYLSGLKNTPASLAALFLSLTAIFGVGGAYIFLGERLVAAQWIGAALILAAVVGISRPRAAETVQAQVV